MNKSSNSFYDLETIGGLLLFATALTAILIANSPWKETYHYIMHLQAHINIGEFQIDKPLHIWINDGLMAIYFLLVGLEIKREINRGILSSKTSIMVPAITALCGLLVPAGIYTLFNWDSALNVKGWAIPTATDIAFTLGIVSLLKNKVPFSLKILLTAIAIFDDMGAIVIIAVFYTGKLSFLALGMASIWTLVLFLLNYFNCQRTSLYIFFGILLWAAVLKSGVHATLAGIIIAMTIPDKPGNSILTELEHALHPWVVFVILPLFAFANAGVTFIGLDMSAWFHPIVLGITTGLFFGKQIGIFLPLCFFVLQDKYIATYKTYRITLHQVYGISLICGVGFTMSLFIGSLAFVNGAHLLNLVKIGVLTGSLFSAIAGSIVLLTSKRVPGN